VTERTILYGVLAVVVLSMLATVLPRITPSLIAIGLFGLVARAVWFYTR
jgi:hypothetical protein